MAGVCFGKKVDFVEQAVLRRWIEMMGVRVVFADFAWRASALPVLFFQKISVRVGQGYCTCSGSACLD